MLTRVQLLFPSFLLLFLFLFVGNVNSSIISVTYNQTVPQYSKQEWSVILGNEYPNPFDPSIIQVSLDYVSPDAKGNINCFYYIPYVRVGQTDSITQVGTPSFLCRLTPFVAGDWEFVIYAKDSNTSSTYAGNFTVTSLPKGEIRSGNVQLSQKDNRYFVLPQSDGSTPTFFPVGVDMKWGQISEEYDVEIPKFAKVGGNLIRIWLDAEQPTFSFGWYTVTEPQIPSSLSNYTVRMPNLWKLDYVFSLCEKYEIFVILVFLDSADFTGSNDYFAKSPFNSTFGGPLKYPWEIFNNTLAQNYVTNAERYIVSRYGYSTSLFAWELFNEQDLVTDYFTYYDLALKWHTTNYQNVRSFDAAGHLITTSFASVSPACADIFATVDFINYHEYDAPDMATYIWSNALGVINTFKPAPWLITESGTTWQWNNPNIYAENDPTGIDINNECWASLMAKCAGTAFPFWDAAYIEPQNLWWRFQGIAKFVQGEDLQNYGYESVYINVDSSAGYLDMNYFNEVWGAPTESYVVVEYLGPPPNLSLISSYQYGKYHPQNMNPPTFIVNSPSGFDVSIFVTEARMSVAVITIDGKVVIDRVLANDTYYHYVNTTLDFTVPAGSHNITIYNTLGDWYYISNITFSNYTAEVRCYALQSSAKIMGWVSLYNYSWFAVLNDFYQPTISDAKLQIKNINSANDKNWILEWWDTRSGDILSSQNVRITNGELTAQVPTFTPSQNISDWAFKLYLSSSLFSPSSPSSPSSSFQKSIYITNV